MDRYELEAVEFLASKDNVKLGLELERLMPLVKTYLKKTFWRGLVEGTQGRVQKESLSNWKVECDEPDYANVSEVQIRPSTRRQLEYYAAMGVDGGKLFYGICLSKDEAHRDMAEIKSLREALRERATDPHVDNPKLWLAWWWTDTRLDDRFYEQVAAADRRLIEDHIYLLWQLFAESRNHLERINAKLAAL